MSDLHEHYRLFDMSSITDLADGGLYSYVGRARRRSTCWSRRSPSISRRAVKAVRTIAVHPGWVVTDMGGPQAPVNKEDSIAGIRRVVAGYGGGQTGRFFQYDGKELPW